MVKVNFRFLLKKILGGFGIKERKGGLECKFRKLESGVSLTKDKIV
jgi:hypothetical protein